MILTSLGRLVRQAHEAHRRRMLGTDPQSGFAMFITLLLILIVAGMSVLVAGLVLSQSKPTTTERKIVTTVNASQAGFEVVLHRLRAATDSHGNGVPSMLPCTTSSYPGTPITGAVGPKSGAAGNQSLSYTVYVRYYQADPSTMGNSDRNTGSDLIGCSAGAPAMTPQYAYLMSYGTGTGGATAQTSQGNRLLHTTYQFRTSNLNIAGGRLWMNNTTSPALCLDAGTSPAAGSNVTLTQCQNRGVLASQSWSYRADLTLWWAGSTTGADLCITGPTSFGNGSSNRLTLQVCATDGTGTTYPYAASPSLQQRQEWSFDDNGKFEGAGNTGDINGNCISAPSYASPAVGNLLVEQGCSGGGFDTMTWNPDKQVGAGPAGDDTQQLVNYDQFGRCLDVTGKNVNATWLITYPCKQAPASSNISWNQRWTYTTSATATTTITTTTGGVTYCLQSPDTQSATASNNLVLIKPCNNAATQKWTKKGEVSGDYSGSYTVTSNLGACLSLGPGLGDTYNQQWASIITETCDGSLKQKWNAPANFVDSRFKGTAEDKGGQ